MRRFYGISTCQVNMGYAVISRVALSYRLTKPVQPCVGLSRTKRWKRANKLNLHPPIEVLAVLLKEDEEENVKAQTAYVDQLLSSRYVAE